MTKDNQFLGNMYPACRRIIQAETWQAIVDELPQDFDPETFSAFLARRLSQYNLPPYLPDLADIEVLLHHLTVRQEPVNFHPDSLCVNPTLSLIKVGWQGLPSLIQQQGETQIEPKNGDEFILIWREPREGEPVVQTATPDELLALKIVVESLDKRELARHENTTQAALDRAIEYATARGVLLAPLSLITRDRSLFTADREIPDKFLTAKVFTLQCHITQVCDLRCKHCYDRSNRSTLRLEDAVIVFDQLYDFCQSRHVYGQVSLSGGNPLLHPQFLDIYRAAVERGFMTAILGNPTTSEILAEIIDIQKPEFFQVSLEGMQQHNDYIRGTGFFDRVMRFLEDLKAAEIFSMVMLTLTRDNMAQVLPLAELLRGKVDIFTFNRLSTVGEGAQLLTPGKKEYEAFLHAYLEAKEQNPAMGLKDSLINIIRCREGTELFGGCAGFGCGAAFNFVALLPDGEVHACRKFNSPIGNIHEQNLTEIYDSAKAASYRKGPSACRGCQIRHVCGGCLAVIDSQGLDITSDCDPCCFMERA